jgi:flagellar export protein FliJ
VARRFRFPLETLLRVRQLREREAQRKVAAQQAEIARLDQLNDATRAQIALEQRELLDIQQQQRLSPAELARRRAWVAHLRNTIAQRQAWRAEMATRLERLQVEFQQARQQTRIIAKLRERRWSEYVRDRQRAEQAATQELAQQLHSFRQIGGADGSSRPTAAGPARLE